MDPPAAEGVLAISLDELIVEEATALNGAWFAAFIVALPKKSRAPSRSPMSRSDPKLPPSPRLSGKIPFS